MPWNVFISHASELKETVVKPLAAALERAGLSVWLDAGQIKLGDSLREQIDNGLDRCDYGVVILSKVFFKKDWTRKELGALFGRENRDGRKVILPVLFDLTPRELQQLSPLLSDKLAVSWSDGIDAVVAKIVEVVLNKPTTQVDPQEMPSADVSPARKDLDALVLLLSAEGRPCYIVSEEIEVAGRKMKLVLRPQSPDERVFLSDLEAGRAMRSAKLGVAYDTTAHLTTLESVVIRRAGGRELATLELKLEEDQGHLWEMSFNQYSSDDIAAMRARRILLNERLPDGGKDPLGLVNNTIMNMHVGGQDSFLSVKESPLPRLYADLGERKELFLALAKLFCVLCLLLTNTVDHIKRLQMRLNKRSELQIEFEGRRPRKYVNEEPKTITISGTCNLEPTRSPSAPRRKVR